MRSGYLGALVEDRRLHALGLPKILPTTICVSPNKRFALSIALPWKQCLLLLVMMVLDL